MKTQFNCINKLIRLHQDWFKYSKSIHHKNTKKYQHNAKFLNELDHVCDLKAKTGCTPTTSAVPIKKETILAPESMEFSDVSSEKSSNTSNEFQPSPFLRQNKQNLENSTPQ